MSLPYLVTAGAAVMHIVKVPMSSAANPLVAAAALGTVTFTAIQQRQRHGLSWRETLAATWRDAPLFLANAVLFVATAAPELPSARIGCGSIALVLASCSAAAHFLLPTPDFDAPTGPYRVGTRAFDAVLPGTGRRVTVQMWYPASGPGGGRARLWTGGDPATSSWESGQIFGAITRFGRLPPFSLGHMLTAYSHAEHAAPLASPPGAGRRFPLVLCSHGLYGFRFVHSSLCAELASEGCVVAAVDHHPDSLLALFPADRSAVPFAFAVPGGASREEERRHWSRGLDRRVADLQALLKLLEGGGGAREGGDGGGPALADIAAATSTDAFGVVGHSYGGGTAVALSKRDPRAALAVALDSWMWPVPDGDYDLPHSAPTLLVSADLWDAGALQRRWRRRLVAQHPASRNLVLRGTGHQNYCDIAALASPAVMNAGNKTGPAPPHRVLAALGELAVSWVHAHHPHAAGVVRPGAPDVPAGANAAEFAASVLGGRVPDLAGSLVHADDVHVDPAGLPPHPKPGQGAGPGEEEVELVDEVPGDAGARRRGAPKREAGPE